MKKIALLLALSTMAITGCAMEMDTYETQDESVTMIYQNATIQRKGTSFIVHDNVTGDSGTYETLVVDGEEIVGKVAPIKCYFCACTDEHGCCCTPEPCP